MKYPNLKLFVTADDRTGSFEIGGVIANQAFTVPVGVTIEDRKCSVVDVNTRHVQANEALDIMLNHKTPQGAKRCHKMDAGMRGNWPHEIRALLNQGHAVGIVPGFPAAGRRCIEGTIYIDDVPLLDSPFGADPLSAPCSSKPLEVMEEAGLTAGDFVLYDAESEPQVETYVKEIFEQGRVLVSPTGPIGSYARHVFPGIQPKVNQVKKPLLVMCGSLNDTSRKQMAQLDTRIFDVDESLSEVHSVTALCTPTINQALSKADATAMAVKTAEKLRELADQFETLLIIGGDTSAAYIQDQTVEVLGTVDTGIPISRFHDRLLITKGGGIGSEYTLRKIIESAS